MLASAVRALSRSVRPPEWLTTTAANTCPAARLISTCAVSLDKESDGESGEGGSVLVDPSKDASLQDLFIIPIRKPLVPGGIPLFEKLIDQPLIQQIKQMEQLNATVRVGLFVRTLGPRKAAMENEPSSQDDQPKSLEGLDAEHLEEVGTLGVIKGFSVGVNEQGQEVVCTLRLPTLSTPQPQSTCYTPPPPPGPAEAVQRWNTVRHRSRHPVDTQRQLHSRYHRAPPAGSCWRASAAPHPQAEHATAWAAEAAVPAHPG
eukprot:jgi/Ulvmu1/4593/UM002_0322.1